MRNKSTSKFAVLLLGVFCLAFQANCEKAELAPYVKYQTDAEVPRITIEEAKKDYDAGTVVIIDSRGDAAWSQEHIAGSISSGKIGPVEKDYPEIPKGKKIIVYCS